MASDNQYTFDNPVTYIGPALPWTNPLPPVRIVPSLLLECGHQALRWPRVHDRFGYCATCEHYQVLVRPRLA